MKKVLGLDVGTNSIGWALIEEENGWLEKIDAIGSRIIPEKDEHRDFEKGRAISKNATRRQKRGARKANSRYKQRRDNLIKLFKVLEITPAFLKPLFDKIRIEGSKVVIPDAAFAKGDIQYKPHELYKLRSDALTKPLTIEELFRVVYHFNQRRGFKSNKKINGADEQAAIENEFSEVMKPVVAIERVRIAAVELTGEVKGKQRKEELRVVLEDGRTAITDRFLFKKLVGQFTVLEIKTELIKSTSQPKYTFSFPSQWQQSRKELNDAIVKSGGYPGKYFYEQYLQSAHDGKPYDFKVRENIVNRELYENEFLEIWRIQAGFLKEEITEHPKFGNAIDAILPVSSKDEKRKWLQKGLGSFIAQYIIFYQRSLKSQVKTISDCRFEKRFYKKTDEETGEIQELRDGPKCCPKSHPLFQEFRIWQQINSLVVFDNREEEIQLDDKIKVELFNFVNSRREVDAPDLKKWLQKKIPGLAEINFVKGWSGNQTYHFLNGVFKKGDYDATHIFENPSKYLQLWHLLYSVGDEKGIVTGLKNLIPNLPDKIIKEFCLIDFKEKQYSSLSLKAIKNLLPLMRVGGAFVEEDFTNKAKLRIEAFLNGSLDAEFDLKTLVHLKKRKAVSDFQGLSYFEAASLIYGKHTAQEKNKFDRPGEIIPIQRHSLRNPVVEQIVNEILMLVKEIWIEYPDLKDGEIRIELARELTSSKEQRERMSKSQDRNKDYNKEIVEEIRRHLGPHYNPSMSEIEKVKLWKEAMFQSPYTGKTLSISEVLSSYTNVDHIIPQSRFYNDGLINKVVCESHINHPDKGNMTAYEYMNTGTPYQNQKLTYDAFLAFIKRFPVGKRRLLTMKEIPDDFIERQKKETQYISVRVKEELARIVGLNNVKTTTGQVTNYLKEQWGLSELMKRLISPRFETLQTKYNAELVKKEQVLDKDGNLTGKEKTTIKGYSKRFDHRHHSLDALIVACTRQGIIQQLNLLNQIQQGLKPSQAETKNGSLRKFIPPTGHLDKNAKKFFAIAQEALSRIVISYKNKKRLVSKRVNVVQKFDEGKGSVVKIKHPEAKSSWNIKGQLHLETNYGVKKVNGQLRHISNCNLAALTENKIKNIPDALLKSEILYHIGKEEYKGDIKKAFDPEGMIDFNKNRLVPIYKVRVLEDGIAGKSTGKATLYKPDRKLEVEKGSNFCIAVYQHSETLDRKFDVVSFFDAVHLKTANQNPFQTEVGIEFEKNGYQLIYTLTHFDMVYVPYPDETINDIPKNKQDNRYHAFWFDNEKNRLDRLYRVVKFSGVPPNATLYFQPHTYSSEITIHEGKASNAKEYKGEFGKGTNGTEYLPEGKTAIKKVALKITVNRLGEIHLV